MIKPRFIILMLITLFTFGLGLIFINIDPSLKIVGLTMAIGSLVIFIVQVFLVLVTLYLTKKYNELTVSKDGYVLKDLTREEFHDLCKNGYCYTKKGELISGSKESTL